MIKSACVVLSESYVLSLPHRIDNKIFLF